MSSPLPPMTETTWALSVPASVKWDPDTGSRMMLVWAVTTLPAANLGIADRGKLAAEYFADVVAFDPATIQDHATFEKPHQYSTGVRHVFVNGVQVLKDGEHTGALPGRVLKGPGAKR